jgi:hypothetical protein
MTSDAQSQLAFYLTGKRTGPGLDPIEGLDLRPALFAGFRDLSELRYDYPVVLGPRIDSLKAIFDQAFLDLPVDSNRERIKKNGLRLEREIRKLVAAGKRKQLAELWDEAMSRVDVPARESVGVLRKLVKAEGLVVDCDAHLSETIVKHAWSLVQQRKGMAFRNKIDRLALKLADELKADLVGSDAGRTPENLKASLATSAIDFESMSQLLTKSIPESSLPKARRKRVEWLLGVLQSQTFFEKDGKPGQACTFDTCEEALDAYRERLALATELTKAIAIAELEVAGDYVDQKHDPFFVDFSTTDLASLPDILVMLDAGKMTASESQTLTEMLSAGLQIKVLVRTDDLLEPSPIGDGHFSIGTRIRQFANLAMGLSDVFVLQSPNSNLVALRRFLHRGMEAAGPALFSVFSGACEHAAGVPPYLQSAAALESRAFPAFVYDPSSGHDMASRFKLADNQQSEFDWSEQTVGYEDEGMQRKSEQVAFTLVDFAACDRRLSRHFARIPRENWNGTLATVPDAIHAVTTERAPSVLMVNSDNVLQRVLVDEDLIREARHCAEMWHSLQELGGVHNSHAERLLEQERKEWEEQLQKEVAARKSEPATPQAAAPLVTATESGVAVAEPVEEKKSDEPYIETPRCTTCNECTTLNNKMFAYNENKQAFLADPSAGTYRQLVEAAESCQVSIIHPGKPKNPNEPGLEELIARAEPFL